MLLLLLFSLLFYADALVDCKMKMNADISCGGYACVARKNDGDAYAWGDANKGGDAVDANNNPIDLTDVADISCGRFACVARKHNGDAYAWGSNGGDAPSLTDVADISCGGNACVARKHNGTAEAWGDANSGGDIRCTSADCTPLPADVNLTDIADISCGEKACVARKHNGDAYAWGSYSVGGDAVDANDNPIDLKNVVDISCGGAACVARKHNGDAYAWGDSRHGGKAVDANNNPIDLTDVADISCGGFACVARKHNGDAYAWGEEIKSANVGGNAVDASGAPIDLTNVVDISCGETVCVARKHNGDAYAWGDAGLGGDASSVDLTNVADISCGGKACVARKNDGTAVAWGWGSYGGNIRCTGGCTPLPADVDLTNVADISCGRYACVARKTDGTVYAWGDFRYGGNMRNINSVNNGLVPNCMGCMDGNADDYNPTATIQKFDQYGNIDCTYIGCIDGNAADYNPDATVQKIDQDGNIKCDYVSCDNIPDADAGCIFHGTYTLLTSSFSAATCVDWGGTACSTGCMDGNAANYNPLFTVQTFDQDGNIECDYVRCDDIPDAEGCIFTGTYTPFTFTTNAATCVYQGGTVCNYDVSELSSCAAGYYRYYSSCNQCEGGKFSDKGSFGVSACFSLSSIPKTQLKAAYSTYSCLD